MLRAVGVSRRNYCHLKLSFLDRHYASQIARTRPQVTRAPSGFRKFQAQHLMLSRESGQPGAAATQTGEILKTNRDKLALRRQSIRMLTNSELRSAHGGGTTAAPPPARTIGGGVRR